MQTIELLAPAKDLACGMAAIDHGADAVYIGAARFGARQAAGNSLDDIAQLCAYAHQFGASVHVTVNTLIYDNEMEDTLRLVAHLDHIGVDAILVQDMGLLACIQSGHVLSRAVLHASTQCDTRTAEKVRWLQSLGFSRAVLARELSVEEISAIHRDVADMELEAFVHGALCVSYSGLCYASQYCFQRSANRGACAQFCRLAFDLKDDHGTTIVHDKHLLSLKDLCQIDHLEELMRAGVCSLKIEGRLKDASYVKNVVAAYSQRLDEIIARHPGQYCRSSRGRVNYHFQPNLSKTFNRGYTTYFATGRQPNIFSPDTPKALGEYVGKVKDLRRDSLVVAGTASFANGDGLCYLNAKHELEGFRVNRAVGNRLFPHQMPAGLRPGLALYRNQDQAFERLLQGRSAERRLPLRMLFSATEDGFRLVASMDEASASVDIAFEHQPAKSPQKENIVQELSKLGTTHFSARPEDVSVEVGTWFVPRSLLAQARREVVEKLSAQVLAPVSIPVSHEVVAAQTSQEAADPRTTQEATEPRTIQEAVATQKPQETATPGRPLEAQRWQRQYETFPYTYNIANADAARLYASCGLPGLSKAYEKGGAEDLPQHPADLIMQCRHCLRYALGYCVRRGGKRPQWREPLHLVLPDGRQFRLEFDCQDCQMNVYAEK